MFKTLIYNWRAQALDRLLKRASRHKQKRILLFWNRGLGDIPLGLYSVVERIREYIPDAQITFLTRPNLADGFLMLGDVEILVSPHLKRGQKVDVEKLLWELKIDPLWYDHIIHNPDPTRWVRWQLGKITPALRWQQKWDLLYKKYDLDPELQYVGIHVETQTGHGPYRNWSTERWQQLFDLLSAKNYGILLFGFEGTTQFHAKHLIDLRGKTPLFELLSIIKNRCSALVAPDSGISTICYYINTPFPLTHICLWADPHQGVLKQNVPSPNPLLKYIPLIGKDRNLSTISAQQVFDAICAHPCEKT